MKDKILLTEEEFELHASLQHAFWSYRMVEFFESCCLEPEKGQTKGVYVKPSYLQLGGRGLLTGSSPTREAFSQSLISLLILPGNNPRPYDVECLSKIQCEINKSWDKYMFSLFEKDEGGCTFLPKHYIDRWQKQCQTSYSDLTELEKESDRHQVHKYAYVEGGKE